LGNELLFILFLSKKKKRRGGGKEEKKDGAESKINCSAKTDLRFYPSSPEASMRPTWGEGRGRKKKERKKAGERPLSKIILAILRSSSPRGEKGGEKKEKKKKREIKERLPPPHSPAARKGGKKREKKTRKAHPSFLGASSNLLLELEKSKGGKEEIRVPS